MELRVWPWTNRRQDSDLVKRVEVLERTIKGLELEWNNVFEKMAKLHARLSKRERRAFEDTENPPTLPPDRRTNGAPHSITNPLALAMLRGKETL